VGIAVEDLEEAKARYLLLGFRVEAEGEVAAQGVRVAMLKGEGEALLELLAPLGPETPVGRFLAKRGPGLHHLAFATGRIEEDLARLKAEGARLIDEVPGLASAGTGWPSSTPPLASGSSGSWWRPNHPMLAWASMGAPAEGMGWQKEGSGKRGLYLGLALGWMGALWYFSSLPATGAGLPHPWDKGAHLLAYALLGFLLGRGLGACIPPFSSPPSTAWWTSGTKASSPGGRPLAWTFWPTSSGPTWGLEGRVDGKP
jgi:methylmalonyl-CoA/ethylmalonyl-CoA epimerase